MSLKCRFSCVRFLVKTGSGYLGNCIWVSGS